MTMLTAGDGNAARPASEWKPASELPLGSWIFSTDDHLLEGSYTFAGRVPKRFADAAPRIVDHDGGDAWLIEGKPPEDRLDRWPRDQGDRRATKASLPCGAGGRKHG